MYFKRHRIISILLTALLILSACSVVLTGGVFSTAAAAGDIIYFSKPADWHSEIYIYWWSGSDAPAWPGREMTLVDGDVYSFTLTGSIDTFNINDGGKEAYPDAHQTVNSEYPGNNSVGTVGTSAGNNSYGNECWNVSWAPFGGLGLSVSSDTPDCDFVDSLTVTLKCSSATESSYTVNGGVSTGFVDGDTLQIGADGKAGDIYTVMLTASDATDTVTKTYVYTKTDSPVGASVIYFDNSQFSWDKVYCYAYGKKENAPWPGQEMSKDSKSGLYYISFDSTYTSEKIIFTNGLEKTEADYCKYPEQTGFDMKEGDCKLCTAEGQWVTYGKPDSKPYGFAYTAENTKFSGKTMNVVIDLKNATNGTYSLDGGSEIGYTGKTTITVGEGKKGNSDIVLTLKATNADNVTTTTEIIYTKTFTPSKTTYASKSDGHTTEPLSGYYGTNPGLALGSYQTGITVDGNPTEWKKSNLIAQGVANDDPRIYMPSAIHERSVDDYALYAAWDDDNIYFMWEMANVSAVLGGSSIFSAQKDNGSIWNPGLPVFLVLSVDPEKHADGKAKELNIKTDTYTYSDSVWGSGLTFDTNIDTFITFDTANTNGGAAIIPLAEDGYFDYSSSVNIGRPTNNPGVLNNNGFKIGWGYGTLSDSIIGINGYAGDRYIGDTYKSTSQWIDFFDAGYKADAGFIYEIAIPMEHLGIDKDYLETEGIGAMLISTFGTSGMNSLPHDPSMLDNANVEYSYDPSTSHEKEDADNISVPLARVGALLDDTVISYAPLEVNFGADKSAAQGVNSKVELSAQAYNGTAPFTYEFTVDGKAISSTGATADWTPTEKGTFTIGVTVTDANGKTVSSDSTYTIGEEVEVVIPPETQPTTPTPVTNPTDKPTNPTTPPTAPTSTPAGEYKLGDADLNGTVNVKDATAIQKHAASITMLTGTALTCADVNADKNINIKDATAIQKYAASIPTEYAIGTVCVRID